MLGNRERGIICQRYRQASAGKFSSALLLISMFDHVYNDLDSSVLKVQFVKCRPQYMIKS